MLDCLYVGLGGFIGSVCRYLVGLIPLKTQSGFPALTLFINVAGAFAVGVVAALVAKGVGLGRNAVLFLKLGVCGGFTTFSAFSLETLSLVKNGAPGVAVAYALSSVALGVAAAFAAQLLFAE